MSMVLFAAARSAVKAAIYGYLVYELFSRANMVFVKVLPLATW
jgi:hypothetical protein